MFDEDFVAAREIYRRGLIAHAAQGFKRAAGCISSYAIFQDQVKTMSVLRNIPNQSLSILPLNGVSVVDDVRVRN